MGKQYTALTGPHIECIRAEQKGEEGSRRYRKDKHRFSLDRMPTRILAGNGRLDRRVAP